MITVYDVQLATLAMPDCEMPAPDKISEPGGSGACDQLCRA